MENAAATEKGSTNITQCWECRVCISNLPCSINIPFESICFELDEYPRINLQLPCLVQGINKQPKWERVEDKRSIFESNETKTQLRN